MRPSVNKLTNGSSQRLHYWMGIQPEIFCAGILKNYSLLLAREYWLDRLNLDRLLPFSKDWKQ